MLHWLKLLATYPHHYNLLGNQIVETKSAFYRNHISKAYFLEIVELQNLFATDITVAKFNFKKVSNKLYFPTETPTGTQRGVDYIDLCTYSYVKKINIEVKRNNSHQASIDI